MKRFVVLSLFLTSGVLFACMPGSDVKAEFKQLSLAVFNYHDYGPEPPANPELRVEQDDPTRPPLGDDPESPLDERYEAERYAEDGLFEDGLFEEPDWELLVDEMQLEGDELLWFYELLLADDERFLP